MLLPAPLPERPDEARSLPARPSDPAHAPRLPHFPPQFLRELISNASDACDKKRFLSLTDDRAGYEGRIRVIADKAANTLTIEDNGIGLTRKDMRENLGKIAQSGTKKFSEALGAGKSDAINLIGQFGVGKRLNLFPQRTHHPRTLPRHWETDIATSHRSRCDQAQLVFTCASSPLNAIWTRFNREGGSK